MLMNRVQMLMNPVQMFTMSVHMFREGGYCIWILDIGRYARGILYMDIGYWALRTGDIVTGSIGYEGIIPIDMDILSISLRRGYLAVNDAILDVNMNMDPMIA
jgi:hypothetical protein